MNDLPVCFCGERLKRRTDEGQIECFGCHQLHFEFTEELHV